MNVHSKVFPSYPLLTSWCPNSINNCISAPGPGVAATGNIIHQVAIILIILVLH